MPILRIWSCKSPAGSAIMFPMKWPWPMGATVSCCIPLENTDHDIEINAYVSLITGTTLLLMLILGVYDKFSATFSVYDINCTILLLGTLIYLSSWRNSSLHVDLVTSPCRSVKPPSHWNSSWRWDSYWTMPMFGWFTLKNFIYGWLIDGYWWLMVGFTYQKYNGFS